MKIRRPKMAEADPVNEPVGAESVRPKGSEAAAILLMLLGDEEAADVLSRLEPDDVQSLGSAMFGVADVSEEQVENVRSEEHTSELQSLMRISYAVFCLKKKK